MPLYTDTVSSVNSKTGAVVLNATDVEAVPTTGGTMGGGLSFGSTSVTEATDTSRHITLWDPGYGITITSYTMNFLVDQEDTKRKFAFYEGSTLVAEIRNTMDSALSLTTKQYVDDSVSAVSSSGTTANRPASPATGAMYFDTDLGHPIWYSGTGWVDATGTAV